VNDISRKTKAIIVPMVMAINDLKDKEVILPGGSPTMAADGSFSSSSPAAKKAEYPAYLVYSMPRRGLQKVGPVLAYQST